jgi:hypothetical protein
LGGTLRRFAPFLRGRRSGAFLSSRGLLWRRTLLSGALWRLAAFAAFLNSRRLWLGGTFLSGTLLRLAPLLRSGGLRLRRTFLIGTIGLAWSPRTISDRRLGKSCMSSGIAPSGRTLDPEYWRPIRHWWVMMCAWRSVSRRRLRLLQPDKAEFLAQFDDSALKFLVGEMWVVRLYGLFALAEDAKRAANQRCAITCLPAGCFGT